MIGKSCTLLAAQQPMGHSYLHICLDGSVLLHSSLLLTLHPSLCSLSLHAVFVFLPALRLSLLHPQSNVLCSSAVDTPFFPPTDLAGEWTYEGKGLVQQLQQVQELAVCVVKALSKHNGADDVGCDALEEEGGIQRGSWRMRRQDRRHGIKNCRTFSFGPISGNLFLPLATLSSNSC